MKDKMLSLEVFFYLNIRVSPIIVAPNKYILRIITLMHTTAVFSQCQKTVANMVCQETQGKNVIFLLLFLMKMLTVFKDSVPFKCSGRKIEQT